MKELRGLQKTWTAMLEVLIREMKEESLLKGRKRLSMLATDRVLLVTEMMAAFLSGVSENEHGGIPIPPDTCTKYVIRSFATTIGQTELQLCQTQTPEDFLLALIEYRKDIHPPTP